MKHAIKEPQVGFVNVYLELWIQTAPANNDAEIRTH